MKEVDIDILRLEGRLTVTVDSPTEVLVTIRTTVTPEFPRLVASAGHHVLVGMVALAEPPPPIRFPRPNTKRGRAYQVGVLHTIVDTLDPPAF